MQATQSWVGMKWWVKDSYYFKIRLKRLFAMFGREPWDDLFSTAVGFHPKFTGYLLDFLRRERNSSKVCELAAFWLEDTKRPSGNKPSADDTNFSV